MDYLRSLVVVGLLAAGSAHAGYAQLASPTGFGGSPGNWTFAPSANDARYGKVAFQPNGLRVPVPGSAVTMPAAYRFAANAPRIAAAAIFMNPYVRAGVGIAAWLGVAGLVWDSIDQKWVSNDLSDAIPSDGKVYAMGSTAPWWPTIEQACGHYIGVMNGLTGHPYSYGSFSIDGRNHCVATRRIRSTGVYVDQWDFGGPGWTSSSCPVGWYFTQAGCVQAPPLKQVSQPEFEDLLSPKPMPDTVPWELPKPTPLPVDQPWINPAPGEDPQHRPLFVPTGDPVPNPNYDPNAAPGPANEPWHQPGIRLTPRPTVSEPWRVDTQPVNRPQAGPEPLPEPNPEDPNNPDKPKPEEQQSLCEKHPDIVACQNLGSLSPEVLQKKTVPLTITKEDGFGPASGACPAPKTFVIMGKPMAFRWDLLCDFASQIRPLLVGFAYLSAALAFMGLSRKD